MRKRRSIRQFNVLSHRGQIHPSTPTFKSGLFTETNGTYSQVSDDEVIAAALRILSRNLIHGPALTSPKATRDYLTIRFSQLEHEIFACLYLDNRHHVIACEELFRGTIDGANVHPREVVKRALSHNAAAVILSHNHPSGVAEPSPADELITKRLKEALSLVDIRVLDHLIVGGPRVESFAERGLL